MNERFDRIKAYVFTRQNAYLTVFKKDSPYTERVLKDLAQFCRGTTSAFHEDPRIHAMLEGRREVFMRICEHLKLDTHTLMERYGGKVE